MLRWGPGVKVGYGHRPCIFQNALNYFLLRSLPAGVLKYGDHLFFFQPLFFSPLHLFEHCCHRGVDQEDWTTGLEFFSFYFSDLFF